MKGKRFIFLLLAVPALAAALEAELTRQNLRTAYNNEVNTRLRYASFAAKADAEGYPGVASTFRAVAYSESIHAARHAAALEAIGGKAVEYSISYAVKSTEENLGEAARLEKKESLMVYPAFARQAEEDKDEKAVVSFKGAMASEAGHYRIFSRLLKSTDEWKRKIAILICRTCGYTTDSPDINSCPFCGHPRENFTEM